MKYSQFKVPEQRIQKGDQIAITVFSDNVTASALFNTGAAAVGLQSAGTQAVNTGANAGAGNVYDVDLDGNIFFPQVGILHVEGLTKVQLKQLLDSKLKDKFLSNPYYVIRFLNLKITVFGDVGSPVSIH